jgi:NAD(P)-dependent dehydrogenase (short-subunit alcohol dehydrogenase family)
MSGLRVLVGLGVLGKVNQAFNTIAHNSWRLCAAKGWDDWSEEIAVVTGGSSGIGNAIVQKLIAQGVRVAVLDISGLPKEMEGDARVKFYHCDVTSSESVAAAAGAVRRELGHPTILVNNAGVANPVPILKTPETSLRRTLGVNLMSMWFTTQQFLPDMVQNNKGHVVTIASIASFVALASEAPYSATKAGALAFHESLSQEIKHQYKAPNVLASVVHPNFVQTPLLTGFSDRLESAGVRMMTSDVIGDAVVNQIKSKRGGQLIIPDSSAAVAGIRGWPTWLQEVVRDAIGRGAVKP